MSAGAVKQPHRHFGYWINRGSGQARCYECQYQFVGDESTAEDWEFEEGHSVVDLAEAHAAALVVAADIAREYRLGTDQAGLLAVLLEQLIHTHPAWAWRNGRIQQRVVESLTRRGLVVVQPQGDPRPAPAVASRYRAYLSATGRTSS
jgi:hypothetical protein